MKIEFAIKTDVKGEVATGAKNIVFEDVGNNKVERVGTAGMDFRSSYFMLPIGKKKGLADIK